MERSSERCQNKAAHDWYCAAHGQDDPNFVVWPLNVVLVQYRSTDVRDAEYVSFIHPSTQVRSLMILLVIIVLFLVLGGGSYHGYRREYYGGGGFGIIGTVLIIFFILALFSGPRYGWY